MAFEKTIEQTRLALLHAFGALDQFFALPAPVRAAKPTPESWSIDEILEHVTLTSHFLLIVIHHGRGKALRRARTQPVPTVESDLTSIEAIGHPDAFVWLRPEHMEPTGTKSSSEVRLLLQQQKVECLDMLSPMSHGEGALHKVRMSVRDLGKLDMYQWLFFLAQHAKRHAREIERLSTR